MVANLQNVVPKTIYPLRHGDSFYPSFSSLFFYIPLARCEGDDSLIRLLLIMSHTKIWLACDTISYSGTMFSVYRVYRMYFITS